MPAYLIKKILQDIKNQIIKDRFVLILNGLILLLFITMAVYVKLAGSYYGSDYFARVGLLTVLFSEPPFLKGQLHVGFFTQLSEILWCISFAICLFSFGLLKSLHPRRKGDLFILFSAIGLAVLLVDDIFRFTLELTLSAGVPKVLMYSIYGIAAVSYSFLFWRRIRSTPYILLLIAIALFVVSGMTDLLDLKGIGTPLILEDGTKFLGLINIILYFWSVCQGEITRSRSY
ncbi:hypothetical protein [Coleofasciculus sp. H7-2]|uniref:hypothetical protein n=1 Tax=Coleofasciculus sp. H7-2 TaxID=3351545 RepID=UPI00366F9746